MRWVSCSRAVTDIESIRPLQNTVWVGVFPLLVARVCGAFRSDAGKGRYHGYGWSVDGLHSTADCDSIAVFEVGVGE